MSADKRKTIEEQTKGLKETVRYQAFDEKLPEKNLASVYDRIPR